MWIFVAILYDVILKGSPVSSLVLAASFLAGVQKHFHQKFSLSLSERKSSGKLKEEKVHTDMMFVKAIHRWQQKWVSRRPDKRHKMHNMDVIKELVWSATPPRSACV